MDAGLPEVLAKSFEKLSVPLDATALDHGRLGDHVGVRLFERPFHRSRGVSDLKPKIPEPHQACRNHPFHERCGLGSDVKKGDVDVAEWVELSPSVTPEGNRHQPLCRPDVSCFPRGVPVNFPEKDVHQLCPPRGDLSSASSRAMPELQPVFLLFAESLEFLNRQCL